VAISGDDRSWFLVNASPDLPRQIEDNRELQPSAESPRNSPIKGVFLTNSDLDHALGLLLLRQHDKPLRVHAGAETRAGLSWIGNLIQHFCAIEWHEPELSGNGFDVSPIELQKSVAFQFRDPGSGKTALIAPAVGELNEPLRRAIDSANVVLFDGTFWTNDELRAVRPKARSAREMNHLPIRDGSLEFLRNCGAQRKIYMHINNTNPIVQPGSSERKVVEQAGIEIGQDGLEIVL
jgi:pyrroloquinoline quinone biosynthesis protein B